MAVDTRGAELKLARARKHIDELAGEIRSWHDTGPYRIGVRIDELAQQRVWFIEEMQPIPTQFAVIAGDAAHNLRAALDHFAYSAVPAPSDTTQFPIWAKDTKPSPAQMAGRVGSQLGSAPPRLRSTVEALEPYFGGKDEYLKIVHYLDIVDKHRLLITVTSSYGSFGLDFTALLTQAWESMGEPPFDVHNAPKVYVRPEDKGPIQVGFELFRAPVSDAHWEGVDFRLEVTLGEPLAAAHQPLVETLSGYVDRVENLILQDLAPLA